MQMLEKNLKCVVFHNKLDIVKLQYYVRLNNTGIKPDKEFKMLLLKDKNFNSVISKNGDGNWSQDHVIN